MNMRVFLMTAIFFSLLCTISLKGCYPTDQGEVLRIVDQRISGDTKKPEYLTPGVYIQEVEVGAKPIDGVGTNILGILGMTERGPLKPRFVDSFKKFLDLYGSYITNSYTTYAVEGFFTNGGQMCVVGRIVKDGADTASLDTIAPLTIHSIGPGEWGNRVAVRIESATASETDLFKMIVAYWNSAVPDLTEKGATAEERLTNLNDLLESATKVEILDNLSVIETSANYYLNRINGISNLIEVEESTSVNLPSNTTGVFMKVLAGGDDGSASLTRNDMRGDSGALSGERTGLFAFSYVDEISILCAPDLYSPIFIPNEREALVDDLLTHCETLRDRFAIIDVPSGSADVLTLSVSAFPLRPSKYGAVYYPWIKVINHLTKQEKLVPPGGHIAGIYARSDRENGVHKAPAGEEIHGATALEFQITDGEQGILNPKSINCIRFFPSKGKMVWGARTMTLDPLWKYVNVRRLLIFLEESIEEGMKWVAFESNDERLWARVRKTVTQFLVGVWERGALMGATPEEAFYVKCDRTTMTQEDIDKGKIVVVIGVAPVKPAEFVIMSIAQTSGGPEDNE